MQGKDKQPISNTLCSACNRFFGNPQTGNMCSSCYKQHLTKLIGHPPEDKKPDKEVVPEKKEEVKEKTGPELPKQVGNGHKVFRRIRLNAGFAKFG